MNEENIVIEDEVVETIDASEETLNVAADETIETIEVIDVQMVEVGVDSAFPALGNSNDMSVHNNLDGLDAPNAHPISAIKNLREELNRLDTVKTPQTLYSDKVNIANYFKWANNAAYDQSGYFVSLATDAEVEICNEASRVFGVSVPEAGFIGNQDAIVPRDAHYGLIVTNGVVDVRCGYGVEVGDYVVSDERGYAKKSDSGYGYKVIGIEDKTDGTYAVISLGVQADVTNALGVNLEHIQDRVGVNEKNIVSAINVANQAYNKASDVDVSNQAMSDKVDGALTTVDKVTSDVEDLTTQVTQIQVVSAQAKAIAESAVVSAESAKEEAVVKANEALSDTSKLREELALMDEGITEIEDRVSIVEKQSSEQGTAIAGVQIEVSDHNSKIDDFTSWQGETNIAMARIEQKADANGAYIQSTVANIDKYSVGPHSQAYGFTLEQAMNVLEEGMIYVPTVNKVGDDKETYSYVDADGNPQTFDREFLRGYLYQWGELPSGLYGWVTVDKNYQLVTEESSDPTEEINTSAMAVYFSTTEIAVSSGNNYGYWYTDGETITNLPGSTVTYEPYTLYKWDLPYKYNNGTTDVEEYRWVAVATLAGNSSNRAVSQIRQDANSIELRVTNVEGSAAISKQWIDDNSANIQDVVAWKGDNAETIATTIQRASDSEAYIAQIASVKNEDGTVNAAASIVTAVTEDESSIALLADNIIIDASQIMINGTATFTTTEEVGEDNITKIHGENIATGTLSADKITTGTLDADKVTITNLDASQITTGTLDANLIDVEELSAISANLGTVEAGVLQSKDYKQPKIWQVVSEVVSSEGLAYELSSDQKSYIVTGMGDCADTDVVIPSVYENLPVSGIKANAFQGNITITSVTIPDSVMSIGNSAFQDCAGLISVIVGSGITSMGNYAFKDCRNLDEVYITDIAKWCGISFATVNANPLCYAKSLYVNKVKVSTLIIPDGVKAIGNNVFAECSWLTQIVIPSSMNSIGESAFQSCEQLGAVFYIGTSSNWDAISINESNNTDLKEAPRYYYSKNPPDDGGLYWHYDEDNEFRISCNDENIIETNGFILKPDGTINATKGKIGESLMIDNGFRGVDESENETFSLSSGGLKIPGSSAKIQVSDLYIYKKDNDNTLLETVGPFSIRGVNSSDSQLVSSIDLMTDESNVEHSFKLTIKGEDFDYIDNQNIPGTSYEYAGDVYNININLENANLLYTQECEVSCVAEYTNQQLDSDIITLNYGNKNVSLNIGESSKTIFAIGRIISNGYKYSLNSAELTLTINEVTNTKTFNNSTITSNLIETTFIQKELGSNIKITGSLIPTGQYNLGSDDKKWNIIYTDNSLNGSDRKIKDNISIIDPDFSEKLIGGLVPKSYTFKAAKTPRTRYGFIAQEVEELLHSLGTSADEVGLVHKSKPGEPDSEDNHYSLNYINLIAPMVSVIQQLSARVEELEKKLNDNTK